MKIEFTIDAHQPIDVVIQRNWFTGRMTCTANGEVTVIKSALNPGTHFTTKLTKLYTVEVGDGARHAITIEHTRPLMMAGFRPQHFKISVDGRPVADHTGY